VPARSGARSPPIQSVAQSDVLERGCREDTVQIRVELFGRGKGVDAAL
jgi:hypothetical protein